MHFYIQAEKNNNRKQLLADLLGSETENTQGNTICRAWSIFRIKKANI